MKRFAQGKHTVDFRFTQFHQTTLKSSDFYVVGIFGSEFGRGSFWFLPGNFPSMEVISLASLV